VDNSDMQQATSDRKAETSNRRQAAREPSGEMPQGVAPQAYRRLLAWQKADELAYQVYQVTKGFPEAERFGLVSQMRRASVSVAANIVEGYTHSTRRGRFRFYEMARSSLTELEYYIDFTHMRLRYTDRTQFESLSSLRQDVGRLLCGLLRSEK